MVDSGKKTSDDLKVAMFGMGCFWGPQKLFDNTRGVVDTEVGYAGGNKKDPTYEDLGDYAETTKIIFDPMKITYEELLELFFENHDPTASSKLQY